MKRILAFLLPGFFSCLFSNAQSVNFDWSRSYGGVDDDRGNSLAIDKQGNVYMAGSFRGTADFDPGEGEFNLTSNGLDDCFVQKMDALGNFEWAIQIGSVGDLDRAKSIAVGDSGNVYVTGSFEGTVDFDPGEEVFNLTSNGGSDIFIEKLDEFGNLIWVKQFGGDGYEYCNHLTLDNMGNIYTTGSINSVSIDFDPGVEIYSLSVLDGAIFILKLDSSGNLKWAKNFGGTSSPNYFSWGNFIHLDDQLNVYSTGVFGSTSDFNPGSEIYNLKSKGSNDAFILKLDMSGNFLWANSIGGQGDDRGQSIVMDNTGSLFINGTFRNQVDFDPGTGSFEINSEGYSDIFILKLDVNGIFKWVNHTGGPGYDGTSSLAIDANSNLYNLGTLENIFTGKYDSHIVKMSSNGDSVWNIQMDSYGSDLRGSLCIDDMGSMYAGGNFYDSINLKFNEGSFILTSKGSADIFLIKITELISNVQKVIPAQMEIYPNPSSGTIFMKNIKFPADFRVMDCLGNLCFQQKLHEPTINLSTLPGGIYFITITIQGGHRLNGKIILRK